MKKILGILIFSVLLLTGCQNKEIKTLTYTDYETGIREEKSINYSFTSKKTDYVLISTSKGDMIAQLYPDIAPVTVKNFKSLVKDNFYTNLLFHRVVQNFVIQTGDPTGIGSGGSNKTIKGEFKINGFDNTLSHTRGVLSMARSNDYNSASSQFFIVHEDSISLDGSYAAFGKVIAGLDVVDKIANVATVNEKPKISQKLISIKFINIEK